MTVSGMIFAKDYAGGLAYTWQTEDMETARKQLNTWATKEFDGPTIIVGPYPGRIS